MNVPVAFPLRIEWDRLHPAAPDPYPAPAVSSRDGVIPIDPPTAFIALQVVAEAAGWDTLVQYARGHYPHARTARPGAAARESLALRLRRADESAVAAYVAGSKTWSWDYLYTWSPRQPWTKYATVTAFRVAIL